MKKLILFLSILFLSDFVSAANLKIKLYNIDDGLNANFINDLTVDNYENIWLATNMGLKKFDGYNFVNYEIPNYNRREIKKVFFQDQLLYILYKGGILLQLNLKNGVFKKFTNDYILDFFITPQETYLLKGNFNIEIIKKRKKINYVLKFSKKLPVQDSENYYGIVSYKNSIYFSIPKMGLFRLKKNKLINLSTYYDDTPGGVRERFKIINHNLFFIGLPRPLLIENNAKPVNFIDRHNLRITDFTIKNNIKYYIRENNTLIFEQNKKSTIIIKQLKNIELGKLYFIGENIFIVSNKGLFKINFKSNFFRNFNLKNILIVKRKILEDNNRILFFGNPYIVSKKNDEITQLTKKVESFYDAVKVKNKFYLATEGKGIVVTDNNFKKLIPLDKNKLETILCVYYDENSNLIYYGNNEFLFYFRPETNSIHKIPNIFKGYNIKTIVSDHAHSRLFVGTENGVFTVNIRNKKTSKFIANKIIGDILIDKKRNLLYIGYDNGILIYNLSNLHLLKSLTLNFLKNPRVTCLLQDNQNRIWGSTYSGLIAYDYNTNNLIELENTDLLNQEYNYKSACKLKNGDLIFGGLDGYDVITPSRFDFSTPEVSGRVSGYYLIKPDDSTYYNKNNPTSIKFKNKNGFLRIYITSNNIENKDKLHYQYKLDNTNWIDLKQEYKDLVGLSPGNYVLQIRGLDEVGKMIKFNPVNVIVTEEFYKSNPFIFTLIFISFLLLILIFRVLYNKVKIVRLQRNLDILE